MTRYTNFGRKRTYVDAGFNFRDEDQELQGEASTSVAPEPATLLDETKEVENADAPVKTKRKRSRKAKAKAEPDAKGAASGEEAVGRDEDGEVESAEKQEGNKAAAKTAKVRKELDSIRDKQKAWRSKDIADRAAASEQRRLKRLAERHANTICFACRETGHAAKDCPTVKSDQQAGTGKAKGREVVGICYRCGSQKHTLSRCRKAVNEKNPLPYASCFVCSGKGHLASSCPENKSKGIYPNGGSCKLCGETTHLAKDCGLRKPEVVTRAVFLGTGREAGADEDDFHTLKRKTAEVDKDEQTHDRAKKMAKVKVGALSGIVKPFGTVAPPAKKVVYF